ncbi:MAG TPA: hypothetical protein VFF06_14855 [Polyangia bacterium]|nr:hypothetical protein [Polyangia bacterium]
MRLGDRLVLHPGIAAELRYDTNVFYAPSGSEIGALILRLLPSLDLATRPPQRGGNLPHGVDFRLHLGADYNEYLTGGQITSAHRSIGAIAGMLLTLFPNHLFTVDLFDNYTRTTQPPYGSQFTYNLDRDTNEAGVRFRLRPGGGRLEIDLSYTFGLDFFEPQAQNPSITDLNVFYHRINLHGQWAFFPKTAVYLDITETPYIYQNLAGASQFDHSNSFPLRIDAGMTGLITTKLSINAWIGYGNGFYQANPSQTTMNMMGMVVSATPNANTALGGIAVTWKPTILSTGTLGYKHDFANSLVGTFYDSDSVYVSWAQLIWRFTAGARLQYWNLRYNGVDACRLGIEPKSTAGAITCPAMPALIFTRTDNNLVFDLRLEYPFKDWLQAGVGYTLTYNNSDSQLLRPSTAGTFLLVPLDYLKHEVYLRLSVIY